MYVYYNSNPKRQQKQGQVYKRKNQIKHVFLFLLTLRLNSKTET